MMEVVDHQDMHPPCISAPGFEVLQPQYFIVSLTVIFMQSTCPPSSFSFTSLIALNVTIIQPFHNSFAIPDKNTLILLLLKQPELSFFTIYSISDIYHSHASQVLQEDITGTHGKT